MANKAGHVHPSITKYANDDLGMVNNSNNKNGLMSLRDQIKHLSLREDSKGDRMHKTTGQFSLISHANDKNLSKPGIFGFKLNLCDVDQNAQQKDRYTSAINSTRYQKFLSTRKTANFFDPEQQFHENMVAYKHSLPPFFKSSKYVLINKEGELLQEETEALRAHLSPVSKNFGKYSTERVHQL